MRAIGVVRRGAVVALAGLLGMTAVLGGCGSRVDKAKYDAALQESTALRERNLQLEQQNRDQAARLADLEARATQQVNAAPAGNPGWTAGDDVGAGGGSSGSAFQRRADGSMAAEIAGSVLFNSGSADLKPESRRSLDRIATEIRSRYAGRGIVVEGHTDSDPIRRSRWQSNEQLSQARAEAVRRYLIQRGIPSGRIEAVGMGSSRPKATKAASRRVEIVIQ